MAPLDLISPDIDAYVVVKFAGLKAKTKIVTSRNPVWNQKINLGAMLPN